MRTGLTTFSTLLLSSALLCSLVSAHAQFLNAVSQGNYNGYYHQTGDNSYFTGYYYGGPHYSYFVFDLSDITRPITYAAFSAPNPAGGFTAGGTYGTSTFGVTDTFTLYAVTDSVASVEAGYPGQTYQQGNQIYSDLVSGTAVGSVTVSDAYDNGNVQFMLNSSGLAFLNANEGQQVVFGGALSGHNGLFSNSSSFTPQLTLAPEPGTYALLGSILLTGAGFLNGRRTR